MVMFGQSTKVERPQNSRYALNDKQHRSVLSAPTQHRLAGYLTAIHQVARRNPLPNTLSGGDLDDGARRRGDCWAFPARGVLESGPEPSTLILLNQLRSIRIYYL
jgi:hypothetical protein